MDNKSISEFIKEIRRKNNLTQKQLAELLGVTYQAVSKWERAINMPDKSLIVEMSRRFNVSVDDIFKGNVVNRKKNYKIIQIIILVIVLIFLLLGLFFSNRNNKGDFQFKTLSSSCKDFKLEGVLSYSKNKSAIYISNISYCGKELNSKFNEIECNLYENNNQIKTKIASYKYNRGTPISLEGFLKDTKFINEDYTSICDKYTKNSLELEIIGTKIDGEIYSHIIPVSIDDNCKKID